MSKSSKNDKISKTKESDTEWKTNKTIVMKINLEESKSKDCEKSGQRQKK
jgi:hypothetical protein